MNKKTIVILLVIVVIVFAAGFGAWYFRSDKSYSQINSYDQCVAAGYPVLETFPGQCKLPDGRSFTQSVNSGDSVVPPSQATSTASTSISEPGPKSAAYNRAIAFAIKDSVIFPDGVSATLIALNDSRCKPGVQCIWQGEITATFSVNRSGSVPKQIRLGTVNNKSATFAGHTFTLQSATGNTATIIVLSGVSAVSSGTVSGYIHTGPTCPVERVPADPACADRPYADANVTATNKTTGAVYKATSDSAGSFRETLAAGTYTISVAPAANGILPRCETREVIILSGQVSKTDVSCDSGIR